MWARLRRAHTKNFSILFRSQSLRSLTYRLDIQMPGFYFWLGNFTIQMGGTQVDDEPYFYPFVVPTFTGFGLILGRNMGWHTPFEQFKRIQESYTVNGLKSRVVTAYQ